jgi:predicted Zn finger-like uncharacterized protein
MILIYTVISSAVKDCVLMIIACPACSTRFLMDSTLIQEKGRIVRCSACGHNWRQMPIMRAENQEKTFFERSSEIFFGKKSDSQSSILDPMPVRSYNMPSIDIRAGGALYANAANYVDPYEDNMNISQQAETKSSTIMVLGWIILIAIVLLMFAITILSKDKILQAAPQTARFYNVLNIQKKNEYVQVIKPYLTQHEENGQKVLLVRGDLMNTSKNIAPLPVLQIKMLDAQNIAVKTIDFKDFSVKELNPGATTSFEAKLKNPPQNVQDIKIELKYANFE